MIGFADGAAAWGFRKDPEYQPVKEIRLIATSPREAGATPEFMLAG